MTIHPPDQSDWQAFDRLAADEGWRVPVLERQLFGSAWADAVGVLHDQGRFGGLVTALAHEKSGWIGNLIVPPELRGRGYGKSLFAWAMQRLLDAKVDSIWLTASAAGRPIYEKAGFRLVGKVERWRFDPTGKPRATGDAPASVEPSLPSLDRQAWGEQRQALLAALQPQSLSFACNDSAAYLQKGKDLQVIGPWYSADLCPRSNRTLLQLALAKADPGVEIVVDLVESNVVRLLLSAAMFEKVGQTDLMVYGDSAAVDLKPIISLASLGSFG